MLGIDALLNQQLTVVQDGSPPVNHEQLCGEVPESG